MIFESDSPLSGRATSSWPISIGTALALESLFTGPAAPYDPERPIPQHVSIENYQEFWINLSTLYRNIMGSIESKLQDKVMAADMLHVLESETELIDEIVTHESHGTVRVYYYSSEYTGLQQRHPNAKLRVASTPKQILYADMCGMVLDEYHKRHGRENQVFQFDRDIRSPNKSKALLLSHVAYDLLSAHYFGDLHLLESHTGILKKKALWYTKYHNGKELARVPFNAAFLQLFGDSQQFHPFPISVRKRLIALADEYKWTAMTTMDRLRLSVDTLEDTQLAKQILQMLKE